MFKISQYYPFSATSTMQLYGDVKLPFNLVYGCILYPRLTEESTQSSLEVRRVYTRFMDGPDFEHHWIIQNNDGSISLDAVFKTYDSTNADGETLLPAGLSDTGNATGYIMQGAGCCGVIRCTSGFKQYIESLPVNIELPSGALVFSAEVVRYRPFIGFRTVYNNDSAVNSIVFDSSDFTTNADGVIVPKTKNSDAAEARVPIRRIYINDVDYVEAGDIKEQSTLRSIRNISIVAAGGSGVRVITSDKVTIGKGKNFL